MKSTKGASKTVSRIHGRRQSSGATRHEGSALPLVMESSGGGYGEPGSLDFHVQRSNLLAVSMETAMFGGSKKGNGGNPANLQGHRSCPS